MIRKGKEDAKNTCNCLSLVAFSHAALSQEAAQCDDYPSTLLRDAQNIGCAGPIVPPREGIQPSAMNNHTPPSGFGVSYGAVKPLVDVENDRLYYGGP